MTVRRIGTPGFADPEQLRRRGLRILILARRWMIVYVPRDHDLRHL